MSVNTTVFPAEGASVDTESKDMLLIIASVAMVVATVSLILMVCRIYPSLLFQLGKVLRALRSAGQTRH